MFRKTLPLLALLLTLTTQLKGQGGGCVINALGRSATVLGAALLRQVPRVTPAVLNRQATLPEQNTRGPRHPNQPWLTPALHYGIEEPNNFEQGFHAHIGPAYLPTGMQPSAPTRQPWNLFRQGTQIQQVQHVGPLFPSIARQQQRNLHTENTHLERLCLFLEKSFYYLPEREPSNRMAPAVQYILESIEAFQQASGIFSSSYTRPSEFSNDALAQVSFEDLLDLLFLNENRFGYDFRHWEGSTRRNIQHQIEQLPGALSRSVEDEDIFGHELPNPNILGYLIYPIEAYSRKTAQPRERLLWIFKNIANRAESTFIAYGEGMEEHGCTDGAINNSLTRAVLYKMLEMRAHYSLLHTLPREAVLTSIAYLSGLNQAFKEQDPHLAIDLHTYLTEAQLHPDIQTVLKQHLRAQHYYQALEQFLEGAPHTANTQPLTEEKRNKRASRYWNRTPEERIRDRLTWLKELLSDSLYRTLLAFNDYPGREIFSPWEDAKATVKDIQKAQSRIIGFLEDIEQNSVD